jgi:hypothetical protein
MGDQAILSMVVRCSVLQHSTFLVRHSKFTPLGFGANFQQGKRMSNVEQGMSNFEVRGSGVLVQGV